MIRPLEAISDEEWAAYWKRNKGLRDAWSAHVAYLRARDVRGAKRWVFMWGWASSERYMRQKLGDAGGVLLEGVQKATERAVREYEHKTGIYLLD